MCKLTPAIAELLFIITNFKGPRKIVQAQYAFPSNGTKLVNPKARSKGYASLNGSIGCVAFSSNAGLLLVPVMTWFSSPRAVREIVRAFESRAGLASFLSGFRRIQPMPRNAADRSFDTLETVLPAGRRPLCP